MRMIYLVLLALVLLVSPVSSQADTKSLYDRLGRKEAISKVVDQFVANVLADPSIQPFFAITVNEGDRATRLKTHLVEQICQATGGPCVYSGRDMKTAHVNMGITEAHFGSLVKALVSALDHLSVPTKEKDELLAILGSLKPAIIEKKAVA